MTTQTTQQAEQLWVSAHDHVKKGDFASATRDLAACFAILQEHNDPRLPEVHRRWTEVHQLAVEEAAQGKAAPAAAATTTTTPSLEAEAEAAANTGDLEQAIALYEQALAQRPDNELVAERLTELRNARPRAAELTSTTPMVAGGIDDEALAASFDLEPAPNAAPNLHVEQIVRDEAVEHSVVTEAIVDDEAPVPAIVRDEAVERSIAIEPIADDEPLELAPATDFMSSTSEALARETLSLDETDFASAAPDIHDAVTLIPQRPVDLGGDLGADLGADFGDIGDGIERDDAVHARITTQTETVATITNNVPQWGSDLLGATVEAPIAADDSRFASFGEDLLEPLAEPEAIVGTVDEVAVAGDDPRWGEAPMAITAEAPISGEDPRWSAAAEMPRSPAVTDDNLDAAFGSIEPMPAAPISGDDPRWGGTDVVASPAGPVLNSIEDSADDAFGTVEPVEPVAAAISGDDPRWGGPAVINAIEDSADHAFGTVEPVAADAAISGDDPRWGGPAAVVNEAPISGEDPRWGGPAAVVNEAPISGEDPRWGGPAAVVNEAPISGEDPRWGGPVAHTAPLMDADDAPVGMPSLDIAIDMGASVTPQQADEMPVEVADDFELMDDDSAAMIDETPKPATDLALADGLPADPGAMLETLLRRVRDNRRAA